MKYLASLVLVLSLGSAAFAADPVEKASPISNTQAKDLLKADANLKKAKHHHHKHKSAAKTSTAPAASTTPEAAPAAK